MKKNTTLFIALFSFAALSNAYAQNDAAQKEKTPKASKNNNPSIVKPSGASATNFQEKAIIWSDDFSNPGTWNVGNVSAFGEDWVVGTSVPSGSFPIAGITSTTAANGYALFDSDLYCSGDQYSWIETASNINLSGQSTVTLEFQEFYRKYTDQTFVEVSNNGGSTWTQFEVNAAVAQNALTTNPATITLDISSAAANSSMVRIRFLFVSGPGNTGDGCDYAWMVDDVNISTTPAGPDCSTFNANLVPNDASSCLPGSGSIVVTGIGPNNVANGYTYSWTGTETGTSGPGRTSPYTITGLSAGTYNVTVANTYGCTITITGVPVGSVTAPTLSASVNNQVSCHGEMDGSVSYSTSGNTAGYTFTWSDGSTGTTLNNLAAGTYTITGTDGTCTLSQTLTVTEPSLIIINTTKTNVSTCGGSNGVINITTGGGQNPTYFYTWTGPVAGNSGTTGLGNTYSITGLTAGNYLLTVSDGNCSNTATVSISETGAPAITINVTSPVSCAGGTNGALNITSTGNINPYTFTWSTGMTGTSISNLPGGTYTVSGTNGTCDIAANIILLDPAPIVINGNASVSTITTNVTGGSGSISYAWSGPGGFTSTAANLFGLTATGNYTLTVTDGNGCTESRVFNMQFLGQEELVQAASTSFKAYPNPAENLINFEINSEVKTIAIFDYTGKMISHLDAKSEIETLDVSNYAKGIYFYKMISNEGRVLHTSKFMVAK